MLTAIQTLRLNHRSVVTFLADAPTAHRHALPTPSLT
jgi:hypothetical protein